MLIQPLFYFFTGQIFLIYTYFISDWLLSFWALYIDSRDRKKTFRVLLPVMTFQLLFIAGLFILVFYQFLKLSFIPDALLFVLLFILFHSSYIIKRVLRTQDKDLFYLSLFLMLFQFFYFLEISFQKTIYALGVHVSLLGLFAMILHLLYFRIKKLQKTNESYKQKLFFFEKEYMRIFEKSTGLYVLLDLNFNILNFNKKFVKALGMEQEEILKKNFMQFIPKVFRNKIKLMKDYLRFHQEASGEFALSNLKECGSIDVFINAIKDNNTVFMLIQDITAVKWMQNSISSYADQLKKEMEYAKVADRMKNVFLANVSHEIRTPLTSVLGFTALLKETPLSSIQIDYLNKIENGGELLLKILNDIIDLSKIEAGRMEVEIEKVNINKMIKEIYEKFYSHIFKKSIDFKMEISRELKENYLLLDNYRIKQVFLNLLSNAAKFTEHGFIAFRGMREDEKIVFEIEDTGIGIAKEKQARVFEPFFQEDDNLSRKYGGTGLGLTISRNLINLMGGEINLYSDEGKGTLIKIEFPAYIIGEKITSEPDFKETRLEEKKEIENTPVNIEKTALPIEEQSQPLISTSKKTILMGEDDDSVCMLVDFVLTKHQIQILRARDGEEVMKLYAQYKNQLSLILLDINLPKINGITIAQNIRSENPNMKIIGFSAYYYDEIKDRIAGIMNYYIKKPFKINEFYDILKEYL